MKLTNEAASPETIRLYRYICSVSGKGILSGQQECPCDKTKGDELRFIKECSGRTPAILGLDYIEEDYFGVNERAIAWHKKGGIVTICWHWGIPPYGVGYPSSQESVDMTEITTPGTELYNGMIANMDRVAEALKELRDANIPVLWRPFHEFDGGWFWWGKGTPEQFKFLWKTMYRRYTEYHKLNNLIWVLGYSHLMKDGWYPGDEFVDITGCDCYTDGNHPELYKWVQTVTDKKMPLAHHENGPLLEPGLLLQQHIEWCWFLTWHTSCLKDRNSREYVNYVYNHPYVINLDRFREEYSAFR